MISNDELKKIRITEPKLPAWTQDLATEPQLKYVKVLIQDRDIPEHWKPRIEEILRTPGGPKKGDVGKMIGELKKLPIKAKEDRSKNKPAPRDLPPGRYAVQTGADRNDLSFYRIKEVRSRARDDLFKIILQIAGPNEHILRGDVAKEAVKRIVRAGIGDSAALYGHKVGRCAICNTRITNRLSRELGIGPICGGRVYDDWETRVNTTKQSLRERGLDPTETVD